MADRVSPPCFPAQCILRSAIWRAVGGAGKLLARQPGLTCLDAPSGMLMDIDRPRDLARAEMILSSRGTA